MKKAPAMTTVTRVALSVLVSAHLGAAHGATYTVSPGQSIQAAVSRAAAGDTVRVLAGTYKEKLLVKDKSGAAGAFITIVGEPGATISGAGLAPAGREGLVTIRNSNYVRVEGLIVTGLASALRAMRSAHSSKMRRWTGS